MSLRRSGNGSKLGATRLGSVSVGEREVLNEGTFNRAISIERKRTERSRKPFLLMLLSTGSSQCSEKNEKDLDSILFALLAASRETDITGWYKNRATVGVLFTEIALDDKNSILGTMLSRVRTTLKDNLTFEQFRQISVSFRFFSDDREDDICRHPTNSTVNPDLSGYEFIGRLGVTK